MIHVMHLLLNWRISLARLFFFVFFCWFLLLVLSTFPSAVASKEEPCELGWPYWSFTSFFTFVWIVTYTFMVHFALVNSVFCWARSRTSEYNIAYSSEHLFSISVACTRFAEVCPLTAGSLTYFLWVLWTFGGSTWLWVRKGCINSMLQLTIYKAVNWKCISKWMTNKAARSRPFSSWMPPS